MPRPTPSTGGRGTAAWWAPTSSATRPGRPRRTYRRGRRRPHDRAIDGPRWHRTDEWYNYQSPVNFEQTGDADYSPRASGVHVLLKLDESTYGEEDGNATDDDHPISWCQRYDGGRSWYTGMGHTAASFAEADYLQHLLGGIEVSAGFAQSEGCGNVDPDAPIVEASADADVRPGAAGGGLHLVGDRPEWDGAARAHRYRWEFGDGSSAFGANQRHRYTTPGTYDARC